MPPVQGHRFASPLPPAMVLPVATLWLPSFLMMIGNAMASSANMVVYGSGHCSHVGFHVKVINFLLVQVHAKGIYS